MEEKVAVVTGASRGIGKAICNKLMDNSYCVIANGRYFSASPITFGGQK